MNIITMQQEKINVPIRYLLSLRNLSAIPAQGCVLELEDVFSAATGALIVSPSTDIDIAIFRDRVFHQNSEIFISVLFFYEACKILSKIDGWRNIFRKVYFYIFDSFLSENEKNKSYFRKRLSKFTSTISKVDHIFVPFRKEVELLSKHFGVPVSYIPLGADVERFGTAQKNRSIDVNAYGRQNISHVNALAGSYNVKDSGRALYYTSHMSISKLNDMYQHRNFFWKMLSMSRIALAYDPCRVDPDKRQFPYSFVGQRWFESLAAGCVVVGYRPDCSEANELLSWEDATIECPECPIAFFEFIENLLQDTDRLNRASLRNYLNMLLMHDWIYRVEDIARILEWSIDNHDAVQRHEKISKLVNKVRLEILSCS